MSGVRPTAGSPESASNESIVDERTNGDLASLLMLVPRSPLCLSHSIIRPSCQGFEVR